MPRKLHCWKGIALHQCLKNILNSKWKVQLEIKELSFNTEMMKQCNTIFIYSFINLCNETWIEFGFQQYFSYSQTYIQWSPLGKRKYDWIRPRKKIPVFPLTCSKISGSLGIKKILFFKIYLASFYRGHILTLIVLVQKWPTKL